MSRTGGVISGRILPMGCANARNTAESCARCLGDMDRRLIRGKVNPVLLTLPPRVMFASLFRYPSPGGRLGAIAHEPSFFSSRPLPVMFRRRVAQRRGAAGLSFDCATACFMSLATRTSEKGTHSCANNSSVFYPFSPCRPVATRFSNSPFWARGRGWALRRCLTATSLRGRPSGPLETSFTARPSGAVVDAGATKSQQGRNCLSSHWLGDENHVTRPHWGASIERGAQNEHCGKSSNLVGRIGRVQRPGSVEPDGFLSVCADSDYRIIAFPGSAARPNAPNPLTKAQDLPSGGPCALSFSDHERRNARCSRRS